MVLEKEIEIMDRLVAVGADLKLETEAWETIKRNLQKTSHKSDSAKCPKCGTRLLDGHMMMTCPKCGWDDY
jgi:rubrerythrin